MFSQLMTLYLTPVVYTYLAAIKSWRRPRRTVEAEVPVLGYGD
jgi:hypothetical protein